MSQQKLKVPVIVKTQATTFEKDGSPLVGKWIEKFKDGPIGGFTFPDGKKSMIYQCGKCGNLTEFNTGYNKHNRKKHGAVDNVAFGFAEEQNWQELDITEDMIN